MPQCIISLVALSQGEADTSTLVGRLHQSAHLPLKVLHSQDPWGHSHLQERPQASDLLVGEPPMEGTSGGPGMDRAMVLQEAEAEAEDAHQGEQGAMTTLKRM